MTLNITQTDLSLINQEAKFNLDSLGDLEFDIPSPGEVVEGVNDVHRIDLAPIQDYENDELKLDSKFYKDGKQLAENDFMKFNRGAISKSHYLPFILINIPNIKTSDLGNYEIEIIIVDVRTGKKTSHRMKLALFFSKGNFVSKEQLTE